MKTQKSKINISVIISLVLLAFVIGLEVYLCTLYQGAEDVMRISSSPTPFEINEWDNKKKQQISVNAMISKWKSIQLTASMPTIIFMIHAVV